VIKDITFEYCLNFKFKDENQYYGLIKMSLGEMYSKCLRKCYMNNND